MKKLFLSLLILASVSLTAFSQKNEGRRGNRQNAMKELNLTEAQQQKMKSLNEDFKTKIDALKAAHREQVNSVLTPEQQAKMKDIREKRKDMPRKGDRKFSQHPRRHNKIGGNLNLSDEQKTKMRSINESFRKQMQDLRANTSLDKDARSAKRKELATAHKEQVNSILTPEQQAKMKDSFKKGRKNFNKDCKFQCEKCRTGRKAVAGKAQQENKN